MVYPVELAAGAVLLAVGYRLHFGAPLVSRLNRENGGDESPLAPDGGRVGRLDVVTERAVGAAVGLLGLLLVVDGLGV